MLSALRSYAPYGFAVVAGLVLMFLETRVSDELMIVLICASVLAHVWLTRWGVRELVIAERRNAIHSTVDFLRTIDRQLPPPPHTPAE